MKTLALKCMIFARILISVGVLVLAEPGAHADASSTRSAAASVRSEAQNIESARHSLEASTSQIEQNTNSVNSERSQVASARSARPGKIGDLQSRSAELSGQMAGIDVRTQQAIQARVQAERQLAALTPQLSALLKETANLKARLEFHSAEMSDLIAFM